MYRKWMPFFILTFVLAFITYGFNANAAEKLPYEYTFEKDTGKSFNGISSKNKLDITFDKNITTPNLLNDEIYVVQGDGTDKLNIIDSVTLSGKTLSVSFKNIEYINYLDPEAINLKLIIKKEVLYFDQLKDYEFPFKVYDLMPGFKSTFVDTNAKIINEQIFMNNAPRDIFIHVPKIYMTKIETIHRYQGVLPEPTVSPALTNIDVSADADAARLKVKLGADAQHSRDLDRRTDVNGFSMGQAGIEALVCSGKDNQGKDICTGNTNEFELRAFDEKGRFLEQRNFKLKVIDPKNDYKIGDYVPAPSKEFGQPYSLYELMADEKLLNSIIERIPVSELDKLGVTYSLGNEIAVNDDDQLMMALALNHIKVIKLPAGGITGNVSVKRDVTFEGGTIPSMTLGDGTKDITVRLNNVTVTGNLEVNVGTNGTVVLDGTIAGSTTIISGGVNSVYLNNFTSTGGIKLTNASPLRIVATRNVPEPNLTMSGTGQVTLEGQYGSINVTENGQLVVKGDTRIGSVNVDPGKTLKVTYPKGTSQPTYCGGDIECKQEGQPEGETLPIELDYGPVTVTHLGGGNYEDNSISLSQKFSQLPGGITWTVTNKDVFGSETTVTFEGSMLKISGSPSPSETKDVVLQGSADGKIYKVKITVTIDNE